MAEFKLDALRHVEPETVGEWACRNRFMKATHAKFNFDPTPYFLEPCNSFGDPNHVCRVVISSCSQIGKDLVGTTPIPTTEGFKLMRDIAVGDFVYGSDGRPVRVIAKTDTLHTVNYVLHMDNDEDIQAGAGHQWFARELTGSGSSIYTTEQMFVLSQSGSTFSLPIAYYEGTHKDLPLDLFKSGLCGIPDEYFTSSYDQRWALVQSLVGIDGCQGEGGLCEITHSSGPLVTGIRRLLSSVGIKSYQSFDGQSWRVTFKADKSEHYLYIRSIERVETEPSYCIQVENPDGLFLCGNTCVLTHNSELILNCIGYMIKHRPADTLFIMDTLKNVQKFSQTRLRPFLRDDCKLKQFKAGELSSADDKLKSAYLFSIGAGYTLMLGCSRSASDLCSSPVAMLFMDELDRFTCDLKDEGDPIQLAMQRQMRFKGVTVMTSTPTTADGNISKYYELGTQERWSVLCPCGCYMPVDFKDIDFTGDTPMYACPQCGTCHTEQEIKDLPHLYAPPANPEPYKDKYGRVARSFKITSTLCHAFYTWESLQQEYRQALKLGEAAMRSFWNTRIGEPYTPPEELEIDVSSVAPTQYTKANCPAWSSALFCGIDSQNSGWAITFAVSDAEGERLHVVEYLYLRGDTRSPEAWDRLKRLLNDYKVATEDGRELTILLAGYDVGGQLYHDNLALCAVAPRIKALRGYSKKKTDAPSSRIIERVSMAALREIRAGTGRVPVHFVNTHFLKDVIFNDARLSQANLAPVITFSNDASSGIDGEYFNGVYKSEKRISAPNGAFYYMYTNTYRNEPLDTLVYVLAVRELARLQFGSLPSVTSPSSVKDTELIGDTTGAGIGTYGDLDDKARRSKERAARAVYGQTSNRVEVDAPITVEDFAHYQTSETQAKPSAPPKYRVL